MYYLQVYLSTQSTVDLFLYKKWLYFIYSVHVSYFVLKWSSILYLRSSRCIELMHLSTYNLYFTLYSSN